jgi:ABC-type Fe3+-hydroxamate transport system substrate-binding protein
MPEFKDQTGATVVLPKTPVRIVSLVPSQTELLHYLGLDQETVGITRFCIHPENWYRSKPRIGGTKSIDLDQVRRLQPDLILGNKEENTQQDIEALREEFPVWLSDVNSVGDAVDMIRSVGALTGKSPEAEQLATEITDAYSTWTSASVAGVPLRIAYLIWEKPYMAAASGTFIHAMIQSCGWINCFGHLDRYPETTLEALSACEPDVILLSSEPYPFGEKQREMIERYFQGRSTVKLVDGEFFSWYGPRMVAAFSYFRSISQELRPGKAG